MSKKHLTSQELAAMLLEGLQVMDELRPSTTLLMKLGSIAVHADEMLGPGGHDFDRITLQTLLQDEEVVQWIKDMGPLLPQKR